MAYQPSEKDDERVTSDFTNKMWRDFKHKKRRQKNDTHSFKAPESKNAALRTQNKLIETLEKKFLDKYGQEALDVYVKFWATKVTGLDVGLSLYKKSALIDFFEAAKYSDDPFNEAVKIGLKK